MKKNALVVEDNKAAAEALCQLLEMLEIVAQTAYGSRSAILTLEMYTPDIIFLDINMPGLSGLEVLGYLKREPKMMNIPVIVITAEEEPQRALEMGALAVLIKPTTMDEVEDVLKKAGIIA